MAFGPFALIGAFFVALAVSNSSKPSKPSSSSSPSPSPYPPPGPTYGAELSCAQAVSQLPEPLRTSVGTAIVAGDKPDQLDALAVELVGLGNAFPQLGPAYMMAARCVRERAAFLRSQGKGGGASGGGVPPQIPWPGGMPPTGPSGAPSPYPYPSSPYPAPWEQTPAPSIGAIPPASSPYAPQQSPTMGQVAPIQQTQPQPYTSQTAIPMIQPLQVTSSWPGSSSLPEPWRTRVLDALRNVNPQIMNPAAGPVPACFGPCPSSLLLEALRQNVAELNTGFGTSTIPAQVELARARDVLRGAGL